MAMRFTLRLANRGDAEAIAAVFSPSFRLLTFLPELHTVEEDRQFIGNVILKQCEVMVAESAGCIVSFLAREGEEIPMLYTHPDFIGQGAGRQLMGAVQKAASVLELWCFQANTGGRRFYERHGFRALRFTDGADNEEKAPDVRYRWQR